MKLPALCGLVWLLYARPAFAQSDEPTTPDAGTEPAPPDATTSSEGAVPGMEALSQTELGALGLEPEGPRVDTSYHFWGFADFTSALQLKPRGAAAVVQGEHQSFYVGNFNVYLSKNLSESFRTMGEVRFTYLPNGSFNASSNGYSVTDTSAVDYANGQSITRWGGIIIQRVYLEWTLHKYITVRGGSS